VVLLCCVLIAAAATAEADGRVRILRWRPFVALGEWSFAFYLVHATVMYAAMEFFGRQLGSARLTAMWSIIILTVAIALSAALHLWVEKPVERHLRAWQDRRLQARTTAPAAA
jgi:peptidoglycan/LPS O-acetylase OafA/YrhL